jgi:hypothetical protein
MTQNSSADDNGSTGAPASGPPVVGASASKTPEIGAATPLFACGSSRFPSRDDAAVEADGLDAPAGFLPFDSVDSLTWQRLIEDRLSDDQYRELLLAMEATPALWRDCALAFLEEQALKKTFAGLRSTRKNGPATASQRVDEGARPGETAPKLNGGTSPFPGPDRDQPGRIYGDARTAELRATATRDTATVAVGSARRNGRWPLIAPVLAVAAGVMLSVYAYQGDWVSPSPLGPDSEAVAAEDLAPIVMDRESFKDYLAELTPDQRRVLFARSSEQAMGMPIQAQPVSMSPGRAGGQRRFLFYRTPNGRQIIVPVDDYQLATHDFQ